MRSLLRRFCVALPVQACRSSASTSCPPQLLPPACVSSQRYYSTIETPQRYFPIQLPVGSTEILFDGPTYAAFAARRLAFRLDANQIETLSDVVSRGGLSETTTQVETTAITDDAAAVLSIAHSFPREFAVYRKDANGDWSDCDILSLSPAQEFEARCADPSTIGLRFCGQREVDWHYGEPDINEVTDVAVAERMLAEVVAAKQKGRVRQLRRKVMALRDPGSVLLSPVVLRQHVHDLLPPNKRVDRDVALRLVDTVIGWHVGAPTKVFADPVLFTATDVGGGRHVVGRRSLQLPKEETEEYYSTMPEQLLLLQLLQRYPANDRRPAANGTTSDIPYVQYQHLLSLCPGALRSRLAQLGSDEEFLQRHNDVFEVSFGVDGILVAGTSERESKWQPVPRRSKKKRRGGNGNDVGGPLDEGPTPSSTPTDQLYVRLVRDVHKWRTATLDKAHVHEKRLRRRRGWD